MMAVDTVATAELLMNAFAARPWPRGAVARVVSVVGDEAVPQEVWRAGAFRVEAVRLEMKRRGEQISALTVEPLRWLDVEPDVTVLRGDPQWHIAFEARKWAADLILIRAQNRTDFRNWMLGSVAKSVARNAPCSVEVIRAPSGRRRDSVGGMRILLATDGSGHSEDAVRAVAERPWQNHTEVKVMSMVNPLAYSFEELGLYRGGKTERAHRAINEAARVLTGPVCGSRPRWSPAAPPAASSERQRRLAPTLSSWVPKTGKVLIDFSAAAFRRRSPRLLTAQ